MTTPIAALLDRARGSYGPEIDLSFGVDHPTWLQLERMLSALNGFAAYNAALQVYRAGAQGWGPELSTFNEASAWKSSYAPLADDLFCFAADILGNQFAVDGTGAVARFDAETGRRDTLGPDLESWAAWIATDPANTVGADLALDWQRANRALEPDERLLPTQLLVAGGGTDLANLQARDLATSLRIRGPIAVQVHDLPPGTPIDLEVR